MAGHTLQFLLLFALVYMASSTSLNIFSQTSAEDNIDKSEKYHHPSEEPFEMEEVYPSSTSTTKLPSFPTFPPLPALPQIPALSQIPTLPPFNRIPKVTATKTLFVEVTKKLTRHPVCMTVYGVLPPCLPHIPQNGHTEPCPHPSHQNKYKSEARIDDDMMIDDEELWADEMAAEGLYIQPTAAVRLPKMVSTASIGNEREERYLEIQYPSNKPVVLEELESSKAEEEAEAAAASPLDYQKRHLGSRRTSTVTKTLWVTKVQRVTDYRVTATLAPVNCVPTNTKIPICKSQDNPHKPVKPEIPVLSPYKPPTPYPEKPEPSTHKPQYIPQYLINKQAEITHNPLSYQTPDYSSITQDINTSTKVTPEPTSEYPSHTPPTPHKPFFSHTPEPTPDFPSQTPHTPHKPFFSHTTDPTTEFPSHTPPKPHKPFFSHTPEPSPEFSSQTPHTPHKPFFSHTTDPTTEFPSYTPPKPHKPSFPQTHEPTPEFPSQTPHNPHKPIFPWAPEPITEYPSQTPHKPIFPWAPEPITEYPSFTPPKPHKPFIPPKPNTITTHKPQSPTTPIYIYINENTQEPTSDNQYRPDHSIDYQE